MLSDIVSRLLASSMIVAVLAAVVLALTSLSRSLLRLDAHLLRRTLATYLRQNRRRHYTGLGLDPRPRRLRRQARHEAREIVVALSALQLASDSRKLSWSFVLDVPWHRDPATLDHLLNTVLSDLRGEDRKTARSQLSRLDRDLLQRRALFSGALSFLWSIALLVVSPLDASTPLAFPGDALSSLREAALAPPLWLTFHDLSDSHRIGLAMTAVLVAFAAAFGIRLQDRRKSRSGLGRETPEPTQPPDKTAEAPEPPIGRPGEALRALNFAGGTFDTVMQLGVAHALLVIQGRAPDAVVGVSAGALNAAALAEILQAGDQKEREYYGQFKLKGPTVAEYWKQLDPRQRKLVQRNRMLARTARLREFIEAAHGAPERLVDALLPDVYQVDSSRPLRPLDQPRFPREERRQRTKAVVARSGLIRLYNDLLEIPLSIGTVTRFIRRVLGISAAGEIRRKPTRLFVQAAECMRLWVLAGFNLAKTPPLIRVAMRAFWSPHRGATTATAGALMSRFDVIRTVGLWCVDSILFFLVLVFWVGTSSLLPALTFYGLRTITPGSVPTSWVVLGVVALLTVVPGVAVLKFHQDLRLFDRTSARELWWGLFKGLVTFILALLFWFSVLLYLLFVSMGVWVGLTRPSAQPLQTFILRAVEVAEAPASLMIVVPVAWAVTVVLLAVALSWVTFWDRPFLERWLSSYNLADALFREHGLREYLVNLFDSGYYGGSDIDSAVDRSLARELEGEERPAEKMEKGRKRIANYSSTERIEPIHVGLAVAKTSTGNLDPAPESQPLVDALLGALAATPIFPGVEMDGQLVLDGRTVANEPSRALWGLLRNRVNPNSKVIHIYAVSPFPISARSLPKTSLEKEIEQARRSQGASTPAKEGWSHPYLNLVDVALRALRLQRFRDATLERRLTEVFTQVIPVDHLRIEIPRTGGKTGEKDSFYRAWVTPIELEGDRDLNRHIMWAPKELRRQAIAETIADGCRAALQVMIPDAIENEAQHLRRNGRLDHKEPMVPCLKAVRRHLSTRQSQDAWVRMPESDEKIGPGLRDICQHCRIWRDPPPDVGAEQEGRGPSDGGRASLRVGRWKKRGPTWPYERDYDAEHLAGDPHFELELRHDEKAQEKDRVVEALRALRQSQSNSSPEAQWPRSRNGISGSQRPTVGFLFSGGVFRGVYQLGVLNALNELGLEPDVIAGASVGSITAAMAADSFARRGTERLDRIRRLAAVYLAIDRIVLTDRFADFVRDVTLRAADTKFSIRQADRVFRKYDRPHLREFDRNFRAVVAGLERLLYVNPFQLRDLVRDFRGHDLRAVALQLRDLAQQFLDRFHVGEQILGAEALEELIKRYVTGERRSDRSLHLTFDDLRDQTAIQFLATTTNLTKGHLEVLGERPSVREEDSPDPPALLEGLLASSAFPGVFRPRWSWKVRSDSVASHQYIDGGVTDNLPVDAVVQFLMRAADAELIAKRPKVDEKRRPHLVVAVSLEIDTNPYFLALTRKRLKGSWLLLRRRAKELRYNSKLTKYVLAERKLRAIWTRLQDDEEFQPIDKQGLYEPLDVEIVPIKPTWLCGTFAFHPMLGFRRVKQARSIAHGCASTLLTFGSLRVDEEVAGFWKSWGVAEERIPKARNWTEAFEGLRGKKEDLKQGRCWLTGCPCPFSAVQLAKAEGVPSHELKASKKETRERHLSTRAEELSRIHLECFEVHTHLRQI